MARQFFAELGLWQILDAGRRWPRLLPDEDPDDDWPSRVLALIANRLTRPGSAHALGAWLESDYVCDRGGRRDVPCWKRQGRVERALKDAGVALSAEAAWSALQTVRHVSFRVQGQLRSGVTPGSSRARQVLKALKLSDTRPPTPPKGEETTM